MAKKMLIIHGYSDGATSFTDLRDFFISEADYKRENVFLLNYASMDDDVTFRDLADKLNADYDRIFGKERIDVAVHSTGALVARAWLALRRMRRLERGLPPDSPVKRLLMFAPANFGSDLATLGESFLGKFRSTFFNSNAKREDFLESGKRVLQGLEPASPFQWELSMLDLHGLTYFGTKERTPTFPFVFAGGCNYAGSLQAKVLKKRVKPGTDGTVRICGTSLNTRRCRISFIDEEIEPEWFPEKKFKNIPFAVFDDFNHGSIISTGAGRGGSKKEKRERTKARSRFMAPEGPGALALAALKVTNTAQYEKLAKRFAAATENSYRTMPDGYRDRYQQFFLCVRDDVDMPVDDYFVDFFVDAPSKPVARDLTEKFDDYLQPEFYTHSEDRSCRAMLLNCGRLREFGQMLKKANARLVLDVTAKPPIANVRYVGGQCVLYDPAQKPSASRPSFLFPNTTTLVDIVLNRIQSSKLLSTSDSGLRPIAEPSMDRLVAQRPKATGRGQFL